MFRSRIFNRNILKATATGGKALNKSQTLKPTVEDADANYKYPIEVKAHRISAKKEKDIHLPVLDKVGYTEKNLALRGKLVQGTSLTEEEAYERVNYDLHREKGVVNFVFQGGLEKTKNLYRGDNSYLSNINSITGLDLKPEELITVAGDTKGEDWYKALRCFEYNGIVTDSAIIKGCNEFFNNFYLNENGLKSPSTWPSLNFITFSIGKVMACEFISVLKDKLLIAGVNEKIVKKYIEDQNLFAFGSPYISSSDYQPNTVSFISALDTNVQFSEKNVKHLSRLSDDFKYNFKAYAHFKKFQERTKSEKDSFDESLYSLTSFLKEINKNDLCNEVNAVKINENLSQEDKIKNILKIGDEVFEELFNEKAFDFLRENQKLVFLPTRIDHTFADYTTKTPLVTPYSYMKNINKALTNNEASWIKKIDRGLKDLEEVKGIKR